MRLSSECFTKHPLSQERKIIGVLIWGKLEMMQAIFRPCWDIIPQTCKKWKGQCRQIPLPSPAFHPPSSWQKLLAKQKQLCSVSTHITKLRIEGSWCSAKLCLTLRPHALQHARLPCPSLSPRVYSDSYPLSWWYHPTISSSVFPFSPASIFPSIRVFSNESALLIRWPKYWSFSFSICPSNEYSSLISFRIDWFDLFAVQGTLKGLL